MKLFLTASIFCFCIVVPSVTELTATNPEEKVKYGFSTGANLANFSMNNTLASQVTGINITGFTEFPILPFLSFRPELSLSQKGASYLAQTGPSTTARVTEQLFYMDVPLLFQVGLVDDILQVMAGPYASLFIGGAKKVDNQRSFGAFSDAQTVSTGYMAGARIRIPSEKLFIESTFSSSFGRAGLVVNEPYTHQVITLRMGFE